MNNPLLPQINQPADHLGYVVPGLDLSDGFSVLEHVAEALY